MALCHDDDILAVMRSRQPLRFAGHVSSATAEARAWDEVSVLEQAVVSRLELTLGWALAKQIARSIFRRCSNKRGRNP